jgi:curved DNA-binding protein CbpA
MQLSPNADAETVSRVYRLLAFRYHPDNTETGNSEMFIRLSEANQILSDPEKRASYDAAHRSAKRPRGKNFGEASTSATSDREKRRNLEAVTAAYLGLTSLEFTVCLEG